MCGAALPNGQTVGDVVRQQRAALLAAQQQQLQAQQQSPDGGGAGYTSGNFAGIVGPNGPTDFKNNFRGQAPGPFLGQAGNFAYWSIGSGILPNTELDIGAGGYGLFSSIFGNRPFSDLHPPFFMDKIGRAHV